MLFLIFLLGFFPLQYSNAGNEHGNGGDGLVCFSEMGHITSVKLLDFHEASILRPELVPDLGPTTLSLNEKINLVLERLRRLDPQKADRYQTEAGNFFNPTITQFVENITLPDIEDYGYLPPLPPKCEILQLAIQKKPIFPEDRFYTIRKDLWDRLDTDNRVGLIFHELIYREMVESGHFNSISARYFNEVVTSNHLNSLSVSQYQQLKNKVFIQSSFQLFSLPHYHFAIQENKVWKLDLYSLLKIHTPRPIQWTVTGLPKWLQFSPSTNELIGTPKMPDGQFPSFTITAIDDAIADISKISLRLQALPVYIPSVIDLSLIPVSFPFTVDFRWYIEELQPTYLEFQFPEPVSWISGNQFHPTNQEIGKHEIPLQILVDKTTYVKTLLKMEVSSLAVAPMWKEKLITIDLKSGESFNLSLIPYLTPLSGVTKFWCGATGEPPNTGIWNPAWPENSKDCRFQGIAPKTLQLLLYTATATTKASIDGKEYISTNQFNIAVHP